MDHFTLATIACQVDAGDAVRPTSPPASNRNSGSTTQPDQAEAVGAQRVGVLLKLVAEDRGLCEGRVKDPLLAARYGRGAGDLELAVQVSPIGVGQLDSVRRNRRHLLAAMEGLPQAVPLDWCWRQCLGVLGVQSSTRPACELGPVAEPMAR